VHQVVLVYHSKSNTDCPSNTSTIFYFGVTTFSSRFRPFSDYQYGRKTTKMCKKVTQSNYRPGQRSSKWRLPDFKTIGTWSW